MARNGGYFDNVAVPPFREDETAPMLPSSSTSSLRPPAPLVAPPVQVAPVVAPVPAVAPAAVPAAPAAAAPVEPAKPHGPLRRGFDWVIHQLDEFSSSKWARIMLLCFGIVGFCLLFVNLGVTVANHDDLGRLKHLVVNHMNQTLELAHFFQILQITDDLHTKDVQCLTLLAECESLSLAGGDQGMRSQLKRMCSGVVTRCEHMIRNHLEQLATLTFDAGACVAIGPGDPFCYPPQQVSSADGLFGLRYDRVGPSSAMFGPLATTPDQSMLNRQEFGVFMAYSFFDAPGASSVTDGVAYVSLNATSPAFGRASVLLETPDRGWVYQFYADHERILALGLDSNKIYSWNVEASLSLAVPGATITGTNMATGTFSAVDNSTLSRPWSVRRFTNGDYLVSMLDDNTTLCSSDPLTCGGLMLLSGTAMATNPPSAPARYDDVNPDLQPPGECAIGRAGRDIVLCGTFGSYDHVLSPDCLAPDDDIFGDPVWGSQVWIINKQTGEATQDLALVPFPGDLADLTPSFSPYPTPDWAEDIGGYIPNRIVQLHGPSSMFLSVSTFGGMIAGYAWRLPYLRGAALAWVLPLNGNIGDTDDTDEPESYTTPLVTDAITSPDDCMLYLASPGLGQVLAYSLCSGVVANGIPIPQLCAVHQLSAGFNSTVTYVHASNPSRPLYGGPANLAVTPDGEYLYASSSSVFDDCLFPEAIAAGGYMVRYKVSSSRCDSLALDIGTGFFVDGNALPGRAGIPARLGAIGFAAGDAHFMQPHFTHGF